MTLTASTLWIFISGFGIAGLITGFLTHLLWSNRDNKTKETQVQGLNNQLTLIEHKLEEAVTRIREQADLLDNKQQETVQLQQKYEEAIKAVEKSSAEARSFSQQLEHTRIDLQSKLQAIDNLNNTISELRTANERLRTSQEEKDRQYAEQIKLLNNAREKLTQEFKNLANEIFEEKGKKFTEQNRTSLDTLLNPFKEQMKEFKQKVEQIHQEDTIVQTTLKAELLNLKDLNQQITMEAHNLSTALRGQKKMQGNWGEMILENILDRSGLVKGKDYDREITFTTEEGKLRPDAIVYLPDSKHLVIDAKVSLNAYTDYVNAEDEMLRQKYLQDHVNAIASRIKDLSSKNYFDLPGLNSPDMVFMFIPIESAYVEAIKADETLFQKSIERNILVATPTTLLTSLNIVRQLWRFEDQNKHTAELADKAGKVYEKLNSFLGSMDALGKQLGKANDSYESAMKQLSSGKGNLIKQANEFKLLGVAVKSELPEHILEKASLELEHHTQLTEVTEGT